MNSQTTVKGGGCSRRGGKGFWTTPCGSWANYERDCATKKPEVDEAEPKEAHQAGSSKVEGRTPARMGSREENGRDTPPVAMESGDAANAMPGRRKPEVNPNPGRHQAVHSIGKFDLGTRLG